MKIVVALSALLFAFFVFATGCSSTDSGQVKTGCGGVFNIDQINIQDYGQVATELTGKLLASGALDRVASPPAVIAIGRIINNTDQQIAIDLLIKKICVLMLDSGKALTITTRDFGGISKDPLAKGFGDENTCKNNTQVTRNPDFTLSGKIIQLVVKADNTSRSIFSFQLSLTDSKTGLAVWEGEKEITKQGHARPEASVSK